MYRTLLKVRRSRVAVSARYFNSLKLLKSPDNLSSQTPYYNFEMNNDQVVASMIKELNKDKTEGSESNRPTFQQITEAKYQTNLDMRLSLYSRDIVTTYNLFTACLRSKEFDRALALLSSMHMLIRTQKNKTPMIDAFNSYFDAWTENEDLTVDEITKWFSECLSSYTNISFDDRSYAILIDAVMSRTDNPTECKVLVRMYQENCHKQGDLKGLFNHADAFTVENLKKLVEIMNVPREDIPSDLQEFFETKEEIILKREEEAAKLLRQFSFENDEIPLLEKDSEFLTGVDSFGLKVIRHSIMALAAKNKSQVLAEFAEKLNSSTPVQTSDIDRSTSDVDFFSIYKSLNKHDQELFDEVLEEFNYERQLAVETKGIDSAREKWRHSYEQLQKAKVVAPNEGLNRFLYVWQQSLTELIEKEVKLCDEVLKGGAEAIAQLPIKDRVEARGRLIYAPFLKVVSPEKLSVITIMELLKTDPASHSQVVGLRTTRAVLAVGTAVETEFNSQERLKSTDGTSERRRLKKFFKSGSQKAKLYLRRRRRGDYDLDDPLLGWTHEIRAKLGSILITLLLQVAQVPVNAVDPITKEKVQGYVPVFYHSFQYIGGTKVGMIRLQPDFATKLTKEDIGSVITPQGLPMLVKPKPWTSYKDGGYLTIRSLLIRSKNSAEQMAYLRAASDNKQLNEVYKGVNVLGETAWTVNKKIFKIVARVWNTGEPFLEIPGVVEAPQYPEKPPRSSPPEVLRNWKQDVQKISNEFGKNRSLRCDTNYKLEIARAFLGEKFYFPHNLDFRGRAYPLSPHFNHLGNDLTRSLLIFWKGQELGPNGLDWLKVHVSNLFGIDKVSLQERIDFANEQLSTFEKCCADPLSEEGSYWKKADKPWQALATMYEIVELSKMEDPSKFISHQPVHQDGTCNGLQHYAALGGDIAGATQVNLIPQDKPADVYSHVAKLVQARVDLDVANGNPTAEVVQNHIRRKVVKQTIMTSVYGVTFVGAKDQIAKQLADTFTDKVELSEASRYLTKQVFASIRQLFEGAHLIQDWLTESAKTISKSFYLYEDETKEAPVKKPEFITTVVWTTPLGLPIVQPYRAISKKQVQTNLQTVFISDPFLISPVDSRRQQSALPPNFVHSLDATHMLKSSVKCGEEGISFAAVHDSYWTHASEIGRMNNILRNQFVDLYQLNIIKDLKEEFEERYSDYVQVVHLPKTSEINTRLIELKKKLGSMKKSSFTVQDELYLEVQRRKLLRSTNPKDVRRGEEIETTISLMEDYDPSINKKLTVSNGATVLAPFKLPPIPSRGDLDINCVKDSLYFFS